MSPWTYARASVPIAGDASALRPVSERAMTSTSGAGGQRHASAVGQHQRDRQVAAAVAVCDRSASGKRAPAIGFERVANASAVAGLVSGTSLTKPWTHRGRPA